jgi:hypothetical protein
MMVMNERTFSLSNFVRDVIVNEDVGLYQLLQRTGDYAHETLISARILY